MSCPMPPTKQTAQLFLKSDKDLCVDYEGIISWYTQNNTLFICCEDGSERVTTLYNLSDIHEVRFYEDQEVQEDAIEDREVRRDSRKEYRRATQRGRV